MDRKIRIVSLIAILISIIVISGLIIFPKGAMADDGKIKIVVTTFSSYDFVKHIVGEKANVEYLLGPGVDAHSYEPSANDLAKIKNADIFVYVGGEMEKWTDKVLKTDVVNEKTKIIQVTESVQTIQEQEVDGADEEEEEEVEGAFDEHIWTSPDNAIKMMEYLRDVIIDVDSSNKETYEKNAEDYIKQIKDVQEEIKEIVDNKVRNRLIFGDKMPMQYFLNEFGLTASAAFSGCSTETEPSAKTITYLIGKVKEENIPVVLYIELSTGKTAKTIAEEAGVETMQIQTLHNVSKTDFQNGESYVSLMRRNLDVLKKALQ